MFDLKYLYMAVGKKIINKKLAFFILFNYQTRRLVTLAPSQIDYTQVCNLDIDNKRHILEAGVGVKVSELPELGSVSAKGVLVAIIKNGYLVYLNGEIKAYTRQELGDECYSHKLKLINAMVHCDRNITNPFARLYKGKLHEYHNFIQERVMC